MAVKRELHPIPTIDEVLQDLNQSNFLSKLELNSAYHQIELSPESRDITTFGTHQGLYRYKRLMFGINCATDRSTQRENFQNYFVFDQNDFLTVTECYSVDN